MTRHWSTRQTQGGHNLLFVDPVSQLVEPSGMNTSRLKLGILLDSYVVPAWVYSCMERIASSASATISLVVLNEDPPPGRPGLACLYKERRKFVYRLVDTLDGMIFNRGCDALKPTSLRQLLGSAPVLRLSTHHTGESETFSESAVHAIESHQLDILVQFGFGHLEGAIRAAARYGLWAYEHGDGSEPPGLWETVERRPGTTSMLSMRRGGQDQGTILDRSHFFTYPLSPARNRSYLMWASSPFLPRQIQRLHRLGEGQFLRAAERHNGAFHFHDRPRYRTPSNLNALWLAGKLLARLLVEAYRRVLFRDTWYLLFDLGHDGNLAFCNFKKILPPKDRFWADPHVIRSGSRYYVFIEEYLHDVRRGHISVIEIDEDGSFIPPVPVLKTPYHLSYPFVFEHDGRHYMVPESAENRTVDLYECVGFPNQWKFKLSLMRDVKALDTTLLYHRGRWWMFSAIADHEAAFPQVELFLFSSDTLFTEEWQPHPLNPIVSDVKRTRPAGRVFEKDGRLYRPSQDCSKAYGYGFDLNEILVLSDTDYIEQQRFCARPCWDRTVQASHTFATAGALTVIDAFTRRSRLF
jgi:hypothetical protein